MKIIMYGADICPDCVDAKAKLAAHPTMQVDYKDITESTKILKEFLSYRDHNEIFAPVIKTGGIGIPFFVLEDNTMTFELSDLIELEETSDHGSSCSIDGKGC